VSYRSPPDGQWCDLFVDVDTDDLAELRRARDAGEVLDFRSLRELLDGMLAEVRKHAEGAAKLAGAPEAG
jgi:hypothetical protein